MSLPEQFVVHVSIAVVLSVNSIEVLSCFQFTSVCTNSGNSSNDHEGQNWSSVCAVFNVGSALIGSNHNIFATQCSQHPCVYVCLTEAATIITEVIKN